MELVISMDIFNYPFKSEEILKNKRHIKKELLEKENLLEKKIAILGGSTTSEIKNILELFLLNYGIKPLFYESAYNQYYEDAVFGNEELKEFNPDIIYIHTTVKNINLFPSLDDDKKMVDEKIKKVYEKFETIWESLRSNYHAIIIQNNFEYPEYRLLGNREVYDFHGKINFIQRLNEKFYEYANNHDNIIIHDLLYVASCYGLDKWSNPFYWHMYKYALEVPAIPTLAFSLSKIIKAIYGKNKKALVMDLDNTMWGGIIGEDGMDGITLGEDTSIGQVYNAFQKYIKEQKDLGVLLNINSKNDYENAIIGLNHPDSVLKEEDFLCIKANWENKDRNMREIADELNIGADSFVFIDDSPSERKIVRDNIEGIAVPEVSKPEEYIHIIDRNGYFETISFTKEDKEKNKLYKENMVRKQKENQFSNYEDFLNSLKMKAEILPFNKLYLERITQLTNKSNQFNLTTKRYSTSDMEEVLDNPKYISLYGKLSDMFGDNGIVALTIGEIKGNELHIDLWLMSCRVLKRDMEVAMMDTLVELAGTKGIEKIYGYYYPTSKNKMVENFYEERGFILLKEDNGNKTYSLDVNKYEKKNKYIEVN